MVLVEVASDDPPRINAKQRTARSPVQALAASATDGDVHAVEAALHDEEGDGEFHFAGAGLEVSAGTGRDLRAQIAARPVEGDGEDDIP
jgi:hypothetical protein